MFNDNNTDTFMCSVWDVWHAIALAHSGDRSAGGGGTYDLNCGIMIASIYTNLPQIFGAQTRNTHVCWFGCCCCNFEHMALIVLLF